MEPILLGKIIGTVLYMALEYWLGKTDKVKAGSVIGVVVEAAKYVAEKKAP